MNPRKYPQREAKAKAGVNASESPRGVLVQGDCARLQELELHWNRDSHRQCHSSGVRWGSWENSGSWGCPLPATWAAVAFLWDDTRLWIIDNYVYTWSPGFVKGVPWYLCCKYSVCVLASNHLHLKHLCFALPPHPFLSSTDKRWDSLRWASTFSRAWLQLLPLFPLALQLISTF